MFKLLKLSWLNVKNVLRSKEFLLCIIAAFAYSMLWIFYVHPKQYGLEDYTFEFSRLLYVVILYTSIAILRNDIKANTTKTLFTGIFTRIEVGISKVISLVILGFLFSVIVEINNLFTALCFYKKMGISGFISINHLKIFSTYIVITFSMGALLLLITSIIFNGKKTILYFVLLLSAVNFYGIIFVNMVRNDLEFAKKIPLYMKTPFYNSTALMTGEFPIDGALITIGCGVIFSIISILIMNKREIR